MTDGPEGGGAGLTREELLQMPKVELHRHLEGSLPPEFFAELAKEFPINLPEGGIEGLHHAITMAGQEPAFDYFLSKLETLRTFYVDKECVRRAAREAIRLAAEDNIRYLELRYNPVHFASQMGFRIEQVIEWVTASRNEAANEFGIQVELVATINREDSVQMSLPVFEAAISGAGEHFVGIDIAGDETKTSLVRFAGVVRRARAAGLGITIHAGEVGPATSVRDAIRLLGADRIGHGIHVLDDKETVELARKHGTIFEVCPTSNLKTGAVKSIDKHPIAEMAREGLYVTVGADDPAMVETTLTDEYLLIGGTLGLQKEDFLELNLTALQGAFRPSAERAELAEMFEEDFSAA